MTFCVYTIVITSLNDVGHPASKSKASEEHTTINSSAIVAVGPGAIAENSADLRNAIHIMIRKAPEGSE